MAELDRRCRAARQATEYVFIVLNCFSGPRRKEDLHYWLVFFARLAGLHFLVIDLDMETEGWDLSLPEVLAELLELIERGYVDFVGGGPPCATWSRARFQAGGPRPLRFRGSLVWGREDLRPAEKERVGEANLLLFHLVALCEAVARVGGGFFVEHPRDPEADPYPSTWSTDAVRAWEQRTGARRCLLDQCRHGA